RDFHSVLLRASSGPFRFDLRDQNLVVRHNATVVTLVCPGARFAPNDHWWYGVHYPLELERGQEDAEDYFVPGSFEIDLPATSVQEVTLTVALGEEPATPLSAPHARAAHLKPIADHLAKPPPPAPDSRAPRATSTASPAPDAALARALALASDDFIVGRTLHGQRLATIIAGYPWFADWGRDTFIALPGLLLETGRLDEARAVLRAFAGAIHHGLVPNRFDDYDQQYAHYNTVDASLWFIRAAIAYLHASGDEESWRHWLAQACVHIVESYQAGTGDPQEAQGIELPAAQEPAAQPTKLIRMTEDGLITAGTPQTQLTWMDAAVGAPGSPGRVVFTPRPGKAVEINALWYSALLELAQVLEKAAPPQELPAPANQLAQRYRRLAAKVKRAFVATFWSKQHSHLIDHIYVDELGQEHRDASLRPNQIFAVALPHSPLTQAQQRQVVQAVRQKLLTPAGLRTLSPDDPHYHGRYTGSPYQRDEAYHQGTVWPWLIGPYVEAVLRVGQFSPKARAEAAEAIQPLLDRLVNSPATPAPGQPPSPVPPPSTTTDRPTLPPVGAVGQLHEIHEGDPPHRPVGCIAQAWSVAEVLRAWRLIHRPA
ncbi:MAG TPA: amylo-alpha-1,6-glucosidase, partial [Phycisphaeraceae bacterium]